MDNQLHALAEAAARLLLQQFRRENTHWTDDCTPLDDLVEWLDLSVATFYPGDEPEGTYGYVDADEDEQLIWLCRDMPETLRRFTLAHELGHVVLHCRHEGRIQKLMAPLREQIAHFHLPALSRNDPCQEQDVTDALAGQDLLHDTVGMEYDPRSQRELAANLFAAELLMPLERVRTLYIQEQVAPQTLAARFGVSTGALLNRLAELMQEPIIEPASPGETAASTAAKKRYDEFQQAAIQAATPALVVAGPGSGKTSTLIGRVDYLVQTLRVPPQAILALTFSRKAAQEMEERVRLLLGPSAQIPKMSTFHAFCAELLREYGTLVGLRSDFMLIDEAEGYFLLRQQAGQLHLRHYMSPQNPAHSFPDMLQAISRAKDELVSPAEYQQLAQSMLAQAQDEEAKEQAERALEVARLYELYEAALARRGDTDFGGLIMLTVRLLREHPAVLREQQNKYQHILVDEFQDINRASGVLLRVLAGETRNVWVVGDANQAIYGFRGASPANISKFETDFPGASILPLSRNYRSRPDLVAIAESFRCLQLELGQEPGKNQPVRLTHPGTSVELAKATNEASELAGIVQDIQRKLEQGYTYKDIMVLCRTRALARKVTSALLAAGLPVLEQNGVLEQPHCKNVLAVPLLLLNESGMGIIRASLLPAHPLDAKDKEALILAAREQKKKLSQMLFNGEIPSTVSPVGALSLQRLSEILQSLQHAPDIWTLLAQYLLLETGIVRDLLIRNDEQAKAFLYDYASLLQMARHFDLQQQARLRLLAEEEKEAELPPLEERIRAFFDYLRLLVLLRQDGAKREQADGEEANANIIRVMTVHASKGLEFPVVYMPGLAQYRFPLMYTSVAVPAPAGMLPPDCEGRAAHESGESCLFYVGVTRARDQLILSYSERYGKRAYKRSLFLDALEAGLPADRITKKVWDSVKADHGWAPDEAYAPTPGQDFLQRMKPHELYASALEAYQRCPRQYLYQHIYRFEEETSSYQRFWRAAQKAVEELRQRIEQEADWFPDEEAARQLYLRYWQEQEGEQAPFAAYYREHGFEVVEKERRILAARKQNALKVHERFHVEIAGRPVRVAVDRISTSSDPSKRVAFERVRMGKRKSKPTPDTRELLYTLASRQLYPDEPVELVSRNLSTGETEPIRLTARKEKALMEEAEKSVQALEQDLYPPRPDARRCPGCPFFFICPE
ncbi:DNA helicase-2/ATP-dependent DNA helicase PcrA [Thermosporothrix hazakensis]|jgi:superfamily I DNA/RNA helicase/Zn-dependent peptidase ImmA (M78 family)/CRISPR/Cas system-associated exonuclease Cas4 (RecB family)|uniref:DNA 3'-5' helicase n=1 Tax=Thermosporothrix hazakensis TaxID=644383 RepID=A0A326U030_THEHA|nr:UvrD-helicase domain-containing protein [Thermosporothrix hazakensis]PZW22547.1 DNA helicase-2/ATP-dependent DNA helicase PcrA [Thermosporothrix hazakensis]